MLLAGQVVDIRFYATVTTTKTATNNRYKQPLQTTATKNTTKITTNKHYQKLIEMGLTRLSIFYYFFYLNLNYINLATGSRYRETYPTVSGLAFWPPTCQASVLCSKQNAADDAKPERDRALALGPFQRP